MANENNNEVNNKKPYMEWIHCNRCYDLYIYKKRTFYLLAGCYHVICAECVTEIRPPLDNGPSSYKCPLCLKEARACIIGNNMPSYLKQLFHPEPWLDGLNTVQIMQFQAKHRQRIVEHIERKFRQYNEMEEHINKIRENCRKQYQNLRDEKSDRKYCEKRIILIKQKQREWELNAAQLKRFQQQQQKPLDPPQAPPALPTSTASESSYRLIRPQNRNVTALSLQLVQPAATGGPRMRCTTTKTNAIISFQTNNNSFQM